MGAAERAVQGALPRHAFLHGRQRFAGPSNAAVSGLCLKTHSRWIRNRDPNNIYRYPDWLYRLFQFRGSPKDQALSISRGSGTPRMDWRNDLSAKLVSDKHAELESGLDGRFWTVRNQMGYLSITIYATKM